jgi:ubiquinone biosynthesis protein UbiJ
MPRRAAMHGGDNQGTMATQSPFSLVEGFLQNLNSGFNPPAWVIHETQRRVVLLLNHVLQQEPEAMARLVRQKGRTALIKWQKFAIQFVVTPAGLLDLAAPQAEPDLTLAITEASPFAVAQALLKGDKPAIRIEGDVQLAAEVNWLVDHVRWDLDEDLSRIVGDAPAHAIGQVARRMAEALRQFASKFVKGGSATAGTAGGTPT